ncbi:uncharacterized protein LOC134099209 [Sardina pilchardus]|uniref:uncharacterized protein LOC134099209 n=1 Tax=Sardina pilchardus TaxID=27697 RepID=UPI002E15E4D6
MSQYSYSSSVTFTPFIVGASDTGSYTCGPCSGYDRSRSISITVVDLVQPNISLSAPVGGLFWGPQGPEVTRGHSLSLICSTEPQHQGGFFHLIFDGSNSTRTQLAINHSASFYIPEADYSHQGNYSCVYEVTVSSRTFKSTQTAPLTVIVRGSANAYGFCHGPRGSPDEDENICANTVMPADKRDCGKEADGDLEEDYYANVEELHGPTATDNDYEDDDIYQNYL